MNSINSIDEWMTDRLQEGCVANIDLKCSQIDIASIEEDIPQKVRKSAEIYENLIQSNFKSCKKQKFVLRKTRNLKQKLEKFSEKS